MAAILSHPRVYKFLHVPVQSGSDAVLADMKREYSRKDFCAVVDTLRELWVDGFFFHRVFQKKFQKFLKFF